MNKFYHRKYNHEILFYLKNYFKQLIDLPMGQAPCQVDYSTESAQQPCEWVLASSPLYRWECRGTEGKALTLRGQEGTEAWNLTSWRSSWGLYRGLWVGAPQLRTGRPCAWGQAGLGESAPHSLGKFLKPQHLSVIICKMEPNVVSLLGCKSVDGKMNLERMIHMDMWNTVGAQ